MNHLASILILGFFLGLEHALEADHVAAVSALITETRGLHRAVWLGALWGLGHTVTILFFGLLVMGLRWHIPDKFPLAFESVVGFVLLILGARVLWQLGRVSAGHTHKHSSFLLGLLHGLAGSGALTLLIVASVRNMLEGMWFLLVFGAGSMISMTLISACVGLPLLLSARFVWLEKAVRAAAGIASIIVGFRILFMSISSII